MGLGMWPEDISPVESYLVFCFGLSGSCSQVSPPHLIPLHCLIFTVMGLKEENDLNQPQTAGIEFLLCSQRS